MNEEKVSILVEALPYIKKFRGKTFVIKYGGSIMNNEQAKKAFIEDVVLLKLVGIHLIIIHGGGPNISEMLDKLGLESQFIDGLRVTDQKVAEIVEMVLSGSVNKEIAADLCRHGICALGISGRDGNLIQAQKKYLTKENKKIDIGYVGEVKAVNKKLLLDLLEKEQLPVISPVGCDEEGNIYNINGDFVASAIGSALEAEKLILLTDIEGIYKDIKDPKSFISAATSHELKSYIQEGVIQNGMIPKVECCIEAIEKGAKNVHLIDGRKEHSLLLEIFTHAGIGTMIKGREI